MTSPLLAMSQNSIAFLETECPIATESIRVRGTVQGVGFRPTVYRLAKDCHLTGDVCNDGEGVLIRVGGPPEAITQFIQRLQSECPPLAHIESITRQSLKVNWVADDFTIIHSVSTTVHTDITPDAATCPQCKADIFDPFSRWYRYPFTNCTHCGPRLSIVQAIPYDRGHTSMASFPMCPQCQQEYEDVTNRRFHAQPVACYHCGPKAWLERSDGRAIVADMFSMMDDVDAACTLLQRGEIVAIKGIGGIHLACDATNEAAVQKLRQRKHRYHKPFALMARDLSVIERYCPMSSQERELLQSPAAPIVLLQRQKQFATVNTHVPALAPSLAPDTHLLGFMLPYTPLHHLMLRRMERPIVLTSGNLSDEPQCITNDEAHQKLGHIADYLLLHNRDIVNRVDDSVVRVVAVGGNPAQTKLQVLRRARGYAPAPIRLPAGFEPAEPLLAMGSELKNTFCLLRSGQAILSQHLGDLENTAAFEAYQQTLNLYLNLFEHEPAAIALDLHPEYLSTKLGQELAAANALPVHAIQHHHAHVAACMVENHVPLHTAPVLGIALDGLGYGDDGTLWGGEFLLADYRTAQRLANFKPVAMIGGEQAIYQPWRNTFAHLMAAWEGGAGVRRQEAEDGSQESGVVALAIAWERLQREYGELELVQFLQKQPIALLHQLLAKGTHAPLVSSAGRLFDAVAAALGIGREQCSDEGQAAIALETLATDFLAFPKNHQSATQFAYPFALTCTPSTPYPLILEPRPLWYTLLHDLKQGISPPEIAARFHLGLAQAIATTVSHLHDEHRFTQVALTGGVFQNQILQYYVSQHLSTMGFTVLTHSLVPANDGGLSLGQAAIAAARLIGH